jgi:hypothetical protein
MINFRLYFSRKLKLPILNPKLAFIGLLLLWAFVQGAMLLRLGVQTPVDSELYLSDAKNLLAGQWPKGRGIWYVSYSSFLAFVFLVSGSNSTIILLQVLLSGVAALCLYKISVMVSGRANVAFLTVFFYLSWLKIHEWNTILYTESLFTSCSIICFALLMKSKYAWQYGFAFVLTLFTFFVRPTGFAFLIGLIAYLVFLIKSKIDKRLFVSTFVVVTAATFLLACYMLEGADLIDSYARGEVIYPNISVGLEIPADLVIPTKDAPAFSRMFMFAFDNPVYFAKLSFYKMILFIGNVKPYFSPIHNTIIVLILYPIYIFAIIGYFRFGKTQFEKYFIVGYVASLAFTVSLTSENWDGRFLVPVLPFIFLLASHGIITTFERLNKPKPPKLQV